MKNCIITIRLKSFWLKPIKELINLSIQLKLEAIHGCQSRYQQTFNELEKDNQNKLSLVL